MLEEFNSGLTDAFAEITRRCLDQLPHEVAPFINLEPTAEANLRSNQETTPRLVQPTIPFHREALKLQPLRDGTPVIAVDCSSRIIGETERGAICALRGAVVWREETTHRYVRYGPFLAQMTLGNGQFKAAENRIHAGVNAEDWMLHLQSQLELSLHTYACHYAKDSIILIDGPLIARKSCKGSPGLSQMLREAQANGNTVAGFSKKTSLTVGGTPLAKLLEHAVDPCILEVTSLIDDQFTTTQRLSRVYAAKLTLGRYCFRTDVDAALSRQRTVDAFRRIMGNDSVVQGYPETLRLAHILAVFTSSETLALQRTLRQRCGLRVSRPEKIRRLLFGPFGQWAED